MSIGILPSSVRYDKRLSVEAKLLYAEITASVTTKGVFNSKLETLAKRLGYNTDDAFDYLAELKKRNHIEDTLDGISTERKPKMNIKKPVIDEHKNEKIEWVLQQCEKNWGSTFIRNAEGSRGSIDGRKKIWARIQEGITGLQMKAVIIHLKIRWTGTEMAQHLVIETVFRSSNFQKYYEAFVKECRHMFSFGKYEVGRKVSYLDKIYVIPDEIDEQEALMAIKLGVIDTDD